MKIPNRTILSHEIADILETHIRAQQWRNQLPGYRKLCDLLQVSPRTMHSALSFLEHKKIILPAEIGKPRMINPNLNNEHSTHSNTKNLIVVSDSPIQLLNYLTRSVIDKVSNKIVKKGWDVTFINEKELSKGKPTKHLDKARLEHPNHRWLLVGPSLAIVNWCIFYSLEIICLGGYIGHNLIPCVAVSRVQMITNAVHHLANIGHSRICSLIHLNEDSAKQITQNVLEREYSKVGLQFHDRYNLISFSQRCPNLLWNSLESLFKISPPTALIATENQQVATIYSFCLTHGINIPRDLSLIVTQEGRHLQWFRPVPAHYRASTDQYVRKIIRWIEQYPLKPTGIHLLQANLYNGESIAPK